MLIQEVYKVGQADSFDIAIAPAPADGARYPIVLLLHGNFGLLEPYGGQLRSFARDIADLGYLAAVPAYYKAGEQNAIDTNIDKHVPVIGAALEHLQARPDADPKRVALVGFSLGAGIAFSYIQLSPVGSVKVFVDFYGYVAPKLGAGVSNVPPTIIFSNALDPVVPVKVHSQPLNDALSSEGVMHEPHLSYQDNWLRGGGHAFEPGGAADIDSRNKTTEWLKEYLPAVGRA